VNSFFSGKHASNNRGILRELLSSREDSRGESTSLNRHALSKKLGVDYTTIHDRIRELSQKGIIEEKGQRPGQKNKKQPTVLWGMAPLGLWLAVHAVPMISREDSKSSKERKEQEAKMIRTKALNECEKRITQYWKMFTEAYLLDRVKTEGDAYSDFTKWLESDKGILEFLDTFGPWPLAGTAAGLGTFRRMIDLALAIRHGAWLQILPASGVEHAHGEWWKDPGSPYHALAEIALHHEGLRKLDTVLRETDARLNAYLEKTAYADVVEKLRVPLGQEVAEELAKTPLFKKEKPANVSSEIHSYFLKDSFINRASCIEIEDGKVVFWTDEPRKVSDQWKRYCEVRDSRTLLAGRTTE
jgi:DNA-binding Lrp family transcriptional regulator